ncbi:ABC transporter substrate-binding protein [Actinokineospora sp. NBRC 105648]|uniref:ABC transporter substrate-binding protein n=1 Tax=Actinokineospora sp. NBRC 105648 TaxID=3032206 RepID=UPI0024A1A52A|nr:ABC transporter substrate-binding protein [Actinokineospora sp. NBRC 105648]GLZ40692.1 ABC transporter substrate-binding protein [Actinokineospora sp. NBRC 105648]
MSRRGALLATLVLTAAVLSGCANFSTTTVTVLHPWSGAEETAFKAILDKLDDGEPYRIVPVGTSSYRQVLELGLAQGKPADIVIMPSLGELAEYARQGLVQPIDSAEHPYPWNVWERLGSARGPRYGVAVKAQLKSLTWAKRPGEEWCMGVGDASAPGWPGTDWVEDILLRDGGPGTYRKWAAGQVPWTGDQVRSAWSSWLKDYVAKVRGGSKAVLLNKFADSNTGLPLLDPRGTCQNDRRSSYVLGDYRPFTPRRFDTGVGTVVSADFAALVTRGDAATAVLGKLASRDTQRAWLESGSGFPVDPQVRQDREVPGSSESMVQTALAQSNKLCFDASDLMPVVQRTAFEQAVLNVLEDPGRLPDVLARLDKTDAGVTEARLDLPCGNAR